MAKVKNSSLDQFFKELRYAPRQRQKRELAAAIDLLSIVEPEKEYPFEFICFRITEYRLREDMSGVIIKGSELADDLRTFIDRLSSRLSISAVDQAEKIYTVNELCQKYSVSVKTVQRWRKRGLVGWIYVFPDGKKCLGFLESAVDLFVRNNRIGTKKAANFSQLTADQKNEIVTLARSYVSSTDLSRNQIILKIADRIKRSREAIRYILIEYEKLHPDEKLFSKPAGVVGPKEASQIYKLRKQGVPVIELMERFHRSRSSIHRIINKRRAKSLLNRKIEFIASGDFLADNSVKKILSDQKIVKKLKARSRQILLTKQEEVELFRRYNFLKFLAHQMRGDINHTMPSSRRLKKIDAYLTASEEVKNFIVEANLGLVVSVAKRHTMLGSSMPDLVSEGNFTLMRAVEKFDYTRGYRFSTYASLAIAKDYARKDSVHLSTAGQEQSADLSNIDQDMRNINMLGVAVIERAHQSLDEVIKNNLTEREQYVIRNHFGLDGNRVTKKRMTLKEVGDKLGLTKERVRQIELIALQQLRHCLSPEEFDLLKD